MNLLVIAFLILWGAVLLRSVVRGFTRTLISIILLLLFIGAARAMTPGMVSVAESSQTVNQWAVSISRTILAKQVDQIGGGEVTDAIADAVIDPAAAQMAKPIVRATGVVFAVVVSLVIVLIISAVVRKLSVHREFKGVDHLLGLIPGFIKAAVYSWAILAVLHFVIEAGAGNGFASLIEDSAFLTALSETNPLTKKFF